MACDVSNARDVEGLVQACVSRHGRLDCGINVAGILGEMGKIHECTEDNYDRVMATNTKGIWLCMKYEIIQMLAQGSGSDREHRLCRRCGGNPRLAGLWSVQGRCRHADTGRSGRPGRQEYSRERH